MGRNVVVVCILVSADWTVPWGFDMETMDGCLVRSPFAKSVIQLVCVFAMGKRADIRP